MVSGGDLGGTAGADTVLGFQLGQGGTAAPAGTGLAGGGLAGGGLSGGGIRGRLLRLGDAADEILSRHDYPDEVSRLLGEALGMATLLAETLAFDGIFTL